MALSSDPYEQKLFQLFHGHDVGDTGSLDMEALLKLCLTLELKERGQMLVKCLLNDQKKRATFDEFREGLLNILGSDDDGSSHASGTETLPQKKLSASPTITTNSMPLKKEETSATTTTEEDMIASSNNNTSDNENESSDREVSPKLIVGTKKYGRKSRPREEVRDSSSLSNSDNEMVEGNPNGETNKNKSSKVQRSASQSDINNGGTKRRRPMGATRLKRCSSLPTQRNRPELLKLTAKADRMLVNMDEKVDKKIHFMKLSEKLKEIWDNLSSDSDGYLNQSQLEVVCEKVGLNKIPATLAAHEVFVKLSLKSNDGICFEEFISLLQSDSDILSIGGYSNSDSLQPTGFEQKQREVTDMNNEQTAEEIDNFNSNLPDWSTEFGSLSSSIIISMWEAAGISSASTLLSELGFYGNEVQISELATTLDDEQQRLGDGKDRTVIVRASLALHKAEVTALRQAFIQLVEENKKLYSDNREANRRAVLLAQEVDDRHMSIETSTRNEIRNMELRHLETVKELTAQIAHEREQLSNANSLLEKRIRSLENDEGKLKNEVMKLQDENTALEIEQDQLTKQITELLEQNINLNREISELEENNRNDTDSYAQKDNEEVLELIDKISFLQMENANLRDKSDELSAEVESLNMELSKFKTKRGNMNRSMSCDTTTTTTNEFISDEYSLGNENGAISSAVKRRGDSPSKTRISDESPRLGKVRKCNNDNENESDSSGDWMALQSELGQSMKVETVTSGTVTSGISQDFSSMNDSSKDEEIKSLKAKIAELEWKLGENDRGTDLSAEREKLKARCVELEASLDQMQKAYEDCEDYWQVKVNDERLLYEEEQRISDEKFNELLKKMSEYEEQFSANESTTHTEKDGRLSPIDEKCHLEQQYIELESEFENSQLMLEEKAAEAEQLRNKIQELENLQKYQSESMLPATPPQIATPDLESPASSPISYLLHQSTIQTPGSGTTRDYQNPVYLRQEENAKITDDLTEDEGFDRTISPIQKPVPPTKHEALVSKDVVDDACSVKSAKSTHSLASTHSIHKSVGAFEEGTPTSEQIKHLRLVEIHLKDEIKDLTHQRDCLVMELQQLKEAKPILAKAYTKTSHPNLTQRIHNLEQKNRHLQAMLKQQQQYAESILHQTWQQQRTEISELRNRLEAQSIVITEQAQRLANADMLVKDLYVENSHLTASVQKLEQQKARANLLQQLSHQQQGISGI